jgi:hypothetical protein
VNQADMMENETEDKDLLGGLFGDDETAAFDALMAVLEDDNIGSILE